RTTYTSALGESVRSPDSANYERLAISMRSGHYDLGDANRSLLPADLLRPPGYPAFLAALNPYSRVNEVKTAYWQCLLGAIFCSVFALLVAMLVGPRTGIVAGVLYTLDWATMLNTPLLLSETLLTVLLTLAVLTFALYLKSDR